MIFFRKNFFYIVGCFCFLVGSHLFSQIKQADMVFEKWTKVQHVFEDVDIKNFGDTGENTVFLFLKSRYASVLNFLQTTSVFFDLLPQEHIEKGLFSATVPSDDVLKQRFDHLYNLFQEGIPELIDYLKKNDFLKQCVHESAVAGDLEDYKDIIALMFMGKNLFDMEQALFSIANRFFEYCFYKNTWPEFEQLQLNADDHPIAKFLYSIMWYHLAGNGWKNWSAQSLKHLKKEADAGKQIVYIAGGSDIYQLIKSGVYNIRIIDPLLPSQPKYYAEGWSFLIHPSSQAGVRYFTVDGALEEQKSVDQDEGIGDQIAFDFDGKKIVMKRESFRFLGDTVQARLSIGKIAQIEKSETVWGIYAGNEKRLGEFTIERRFVEQDDFAYIKNKNKAILISFNELYFISTTANKGGWGINPYRFDKRLKMHVKQLHNPIEAHVIQNMRKAFEHMEFNYIALGTCVN